MESEVSDLRKQLQEKDKEIERLKKLLTIKTPTAVEEKDICVQHQSEARDKLSNAEISRYSRQLILPEIGVKGQLSISSASVLVVGAGGLGCPSSIYLAAAGIGRIGLVDYDEVELTNLHRQILHTETKVGVTKSASAAHACKSLNTHVECIPYHLQLNSSNALQLIQQYDIVLDATDNVATRYLLNDACILANKPLVSGSALRFEGQLTVYNYNGGPCYRCLYPKPPPPETVTNCSDGGVLGVVPGIIGCLQALEALKIAAGVGSSFSQVMLMFDGLDGTFRRIKLRGRQPSCPLCGTEPSITQLIDYEQFCGARANDKDKCLKVLDSKQRITVHEYNKMLETKSNHILVDVRTEVEMDICQLPHQPINIPISRIGHDESIALLQKQLKTSDEKPAVIVVCRRGNDSQIAVKTLLKCFKDSEVDIKDIRGGLYAWAKHIDTNFPVY
ncbi:adenylyltransferase and sulfurtransferase MOCS3-like [Ylistrum balloti]|uniref:adenylyltransferase and sulfurtransferase MOCS3-like n=1 Tax=Ylistrum balloti TaxID=509963 RepID=UPI002905DF10|nr:adenylyltransferase and sulfurtransferase MOCS3-like [Ylistrum balloti]